MSASRTIHPRAFFHREAKVPQDRPARKDSAERTAFPVYREKLDPRAQWDRQDGAVPLAEEATMASQASRERLVHPGYLAPLAHPAAP